MNNKNTGTRCEIISKLTIRTPERREWSRSGVFINFEHVNAGWEYDIKDVVTNFFYFLVL